MKKTRVAILFLLLTLFAACLPAAAELPAQIEWPCLGKNQVHNFIEYVAIGNWHHGLYQCTYCGKSFVPAHPREGHSGGTETPTCTTGKTCALCGAEYDILGHDWGEWTPNDDGTHTRRCKRSNCDAVENESCSGGTGTFTCTTGKTCEKCGAEYGILGHDWDRWTPIYDGTHTHTRRCKRCNAEETGSCSGGYADCTSLGMCYICGGSYYGGHEWGEWSSAGNGTHIRNCKNCYKVDTASCTGGTATCTAKAVCVECGGEYGEKDPNNHDLVHFRAKAPTCTEIGWDAYDRCIRCGYTTRKELPAQHDLKQHAAKAPTCTEKGWNAYETCKNCNYTTYAELSALNHDFVHHEAKAPTCTEIGWDAYDTCSNCDYTTYVEIPASGHALTHHEAKAATCTEIGWNAYDTCGNCGYTTYAEIPASGHVLTNYGENWGLVFCPVCGKVENGERLELLETASAAAVDGKLPEGELVARMNQRYLSLAFVHEGKLTAPAGRVKITLPAEIVRGKRLLLIAPDGTETELPFETVGETISFTLDFTEVENPAVLVLKPL